jgi:hypothetical protein
VTTALPCPADLDSGDAIRYTAAMPDELREVTSAANEPEATMICQLLAEAGIGAIPKPTTGVGVGFNAGGPYAIYVEADQFDAAKQVLEPAEGVSES